jgi:hypothetical protein
MAERLRAVKGMVYPDPKSLELVRGAGGLSKLTPDQRKKVRLRRVKAGDWCDDVPPESLEHLIKKGGVVRVQVEEGINYKLTDTRRKKAHLGEKVSIMPPLKKKEK